MLELLYTSPRQTFAGWNSALVLRRLVFSRTWDCMVLEGSGASGANRVGGTFKIFKDGHAVRCMDVNADVAATFIMLEMEDGVLGTFVKTGSSPYLYQLYELDPFTATPVSNPFSTFSSTLPLGRGWYIDRRRALILRPDGSYLRAYSLADPPVLQWSLSLAESFYAIHAVADGRVMLSKTRYEGGVQTPRVLFVDYLARAIVLRSQLNSYRAAVFDSHCGVVMAINASGYTEIYYPQAVPHRLTPPVLDPDPVGLYGGSLVSTQVLGDLDEPCPDRVVHWYLENGLGGLARQTSKSGPDGTASNYYFAPDDPARAGQEETVRVEALI